MRLFYEVFVLNYLSIKHHYVTTHSIHVDCRISVSDSKIAIFETDLGNGIRRIHFQIWTIRFPSTPTPSLLRDARDPRVNVTSFTRNMATTTATDIE